jgi:hypothetical protein
MTGWFLKHRWQKIVLIILVMAGLLALALALFLNSFLTSKLTAKLKDAVLKGTDSLYHVDFSKVELHVFEGKATLYNITFGPDTTVYHKLQERGDAPNHLYELRVKRLEVSGAHPLQTWFKKKMNIGRVTLNNPEIYICKNTDKPHQKERKDKRTLYQKISNSFKMIHVGEIDLDAITFTYRDKSGPKPSASVLKEMNLQATDLLIDSTTQTDTSRTFYCRDIVTELKHYTGTWAGGLYKYKVTSIKLSTREARLDIAGIDIQPLSVKDFFAKSKNDRFKLHLDKVTLHHFDYRTYRREEGLVTSKVIVDKGNFEVFTNPHGRLKTTDRLVTFPNWAIRQIKTGLNVDTLDIKKIDVTYREFKEKSGQTGAVRFDNITGRFLNLTNKKTILRQHPVCTVNLSTYFMGKGKLDLVFGFNLGDEAYSYSYKGHLGPMDMLAANSAVMPLGLVKITSGRVNSLDFNIHGNKKSGAGKVTFLYNNLKVDLLKRDEEKVYAKKSFMSLFANAVILKQDNPDEGKPVPRSANVVFIRPANFPFFKTIWLTLLGGIKSCAGVGKSQEKEAGEPLTEKDKKEQAKALKKAREKKEKEDKKFREQLEKKKN